MLCPKCHSEMNAVLCRSVEIDRCSRCGGIWLDAGEKEMIMDPSALEMCDTGDGKLGEKNNPITPVYCPRCETRMFHVVNLYDSGITFERCVTCSGYFFDAGELRRAHKGTFLDLLKNLIPRRDWVVLKNDHSLIWTR